MHSGSFIGSRFSLYQVNQFLHPSGILSGLHPKKNPSYYIQKEICNVNAFKSVLTKIKVIPILSPLRDAKTEFAKQG